MNQNYYIAVFETKNNAVFLYSILERTGQKIFQLVSAPCNIRVGCNYAIKFSNINSIDIIIKATNEININIPDIYFAEKINGRYNYRKI